MAGDWGTSSQSQTTYLHHERDKSFHFTTQVHHNYREQWLHMKKKNKKKNECTEALMSKHEKDEQEGTLADHLYVIYKHFHTFFPSSL